MSQRIRITIPKTTVTYMAILAVAVVGAVMREINLLIILAGLMSGPLLISRLMIRSTLRDLDVRRFVPRNVFLGAPCRVELEVHNKKRRVDGWALVVEDRIHIVSHTKTEKLTARALVTHVAAGGTERTRYEATFLTRGRYRFGPLQLTTKVPVGLLKGHRTFRRVDEVVVYPKLGELLDGWSSFARFEHAGNQSSRKRQGPVDGDFYGLRDWRAGDSRRWIHWRSSAKRNELVVRQFEERQNHNLMLLLDLSVDNESAAPDQSTVEQAVSFVATLVARQCSRGAGLLTLCVNGNRQLQVRGPASTGVMNDALEVLAETESSTFDGNSDDQLIGLPPIAGEDQVLAISFGKFDWSRWISSDDPMAGRYAAQAVELDLTTDMLGKIFHVDHRVDSGRKQAKEASAAKKKPASQPPLAPTFSGRL